MSPYFSREYFEIRIKMSLIKIKMSLILKTVKKIILIANNECH